MELFAEQGFAATTVPQIADRAGLTTRSFFRWYADKREVLFVGEDELPTVVENFFAQVDPSLEPIEVIRHAFRAELASRHELLRSELQARRAIVQTDEGLQERQLKKHTILLGAAVRGFGERGLSAINAELAGRLAVAIYESAIERWLTDGTRSLADVSDELLDALPDIVRPTA